MTSRAGTIGAIALFATTLALPSFAVGPYSGVGKARGIHQPSGTTCRTVETRVEERPDARCEASGLRRVEVDERECTRLRGGHLEDFYTRGEERPQACVEAGAAGGPAAAIP